MWLQKTACKRGKTSSTSGLLTNLQINKSAKVYSKVFIPGPSRVRRARAALSAEPVAAIERPQRSRATSANQAEMFMIESGLGRSPGCARDGVDRGVFLTDPRPKTGPMCCLCTRIDDARRGQSHPPPGPPTPGWAHSSSFLRHSRHLMSPFFGILTIFSGL